MSAISKGSLLQESLNQPWPVAGSELFVSSRNTANRLDSPKLIWMLLQDAFASQRITLNAASLPQLHKLDASLSLSHKILNRLAFVDLYYEQLSTHGYLDSEILNLLHRLRPALIRAVLHNDSIITNSKHPLRIVLDDICSWGIGWDKNLGKSGERYFALLTNLVTVTTCLSEDIRELPDSYKTTLGTLQETISRHQQLEDRVCEAEQATMESLAIQRQVEMVINERIGNQLLPPSTVPFFHGVWRDLLYRLRVLHKIDNAHWSEALQIMDQLIFCLSPHPEKKQEQTNLIPGLIQSLKRVLQKSGYDASNTYLLDDLITTFKQIMTGENIPVQPTPPLSSLKVEGVSTTISSTIAQQVVQLKPGQWILHKGNNSEMTRSRLARIFPEAGQILFVNLLGAKPFSRSIEELGLAINTKRAQLLVSNNLSGIVLTLSIDLFIKHYQKATHQESSTNPSDGFRKKSAEKALAEAHTLRAISTTEPKAAQPTTPLAEEENIKIEALVHSLKIGSWISMKNRLGEQMPCKISVIYPSTGKMVITDKAGLRVGEFLRPEIVQLIMKGEASILEMADSFENSLSRVLQTLRKIP